MYRDSPIEVRSAFQLGELDVDKGNRLKGENHTKYCGEATTVLGCLLKT